MNRGAFAYAAAATATATTRKPGGWPVHQSRPALLFRCVKGIGDNRQFPAKGRTMSVGTRPALEYLIVPHRQ